ncbi:MAG: AEC family transporter [Porticoccaceae bacterium]|nr:AEC family transporter [Porticoccaceae bacterium]
MQHLEVVGFVFTAILPVYLLTALGVLLRRMGWLSEGFLHDSSRIVFNFAAPTMLFLSLSSADLSLAEAPRFLSVSVGLLIFLSLLAWALAPIMVSQRADRGVFIQGATRGNLLISGLAMAYNVYGLEGVALASLPMGIYIIFNNIYSISILKFYSQQEGSPAKNYLSDIVKNPIIISVFLGTLAGALKLQLPEALANSGRLLGQMTVPLVLINVGASLDFTQLRSPSLAGWGAALYKCLLMPALGVPLAWYCGLRGMELGIMFLVLSSPTSTISVVFAQVFGGNARMAANIVLLGGLFSFLIVVAGLIFLRSFGFA